MSLTKRNIARAIHAAEPRVSIAEAVSLVDFIFTTLKDRLAAGDKVMITNFGTFRKVERAPRRGINPATGDVLTIAAHRGVSFRPSPSLRHLLNADAATERRDVDPAGSE